MDPISIAMFLFNRTFDLMSMMLRKKELEKLRECQDVADPNVRMWILQEIDKVSFKLDCQSRISLKTSKSHFKDGLGYLNEVLIDKTVGKKDTATAQTTKPPGGIGQLTFSAEKTDPTGDVKCLKGADLDESSKKYLKKAQEAFKQASNEAIKAFHDVNLGVTERLEAMYIRIMATILEGVDDPSGISIPCGNCLAEVQRVPKIKGIFDAVIRKKKASEQDVTIFVGVCQIYRVIHDVTLQLSHQCSSPWTWPCIKIEGKKTNHKIEPLRDVRVAEALYQLQREKAEKGETALKSIADLPVVWSFGAADNGKLISPRYVATNTEGQFIVIDDGDRTIKVFDETGTFMKFNSFRPLCSHLADEDILSVVTDQEDNIFVLIKIDKYRHEVCVFNKHVQFSHKFPLREGVVRCLPIINENNQVLVVVEQKDQKISFVEVYKSDGELVDSFRQEILKKAKDMTIVNEGRLMILDGLKHVVVFDAEGNHMPELDFDHEGVPPEAIAFHSESKHVIVSSLEPGGRVKMSIYNEKREWVNSIYQGEERKVMEETECVPPKIAVTKDGRIAILAGIVGESKVIVV